VNSGIPPRPRSDLQLDFGILEKLTHLQVLRLANLLPGEGRSLGKAVQNLHNLKELKITVASLNNAFHHAQDIGSRISPIDDFMESVFPQSSEGDSEQNRTGGLPRSLTNFMLMDRYSP